MNANTNAKASYSPVQPDHQTNPDVVGSVVVVKSRSHYRYREVVAKKTRFSKERDVSEMGRSYRLGVDGVSAFLSRLCILRPCSLALAR